MPSHRLLRLWNLSYALTKAREVRWCAQVEVPYRLGTLSDRTRACSEAVSVVLEDSRADFVSGESA